MYLSDLIEDTKNDDIEGVRKARDFYKSCMNESRFVWFYLHVIILIHSCITHVRNYAITHMHYTNYTHLRKHIICRQFFSVT